MKHRVVVARCDNSIESMVRPSARDHEHRRVSGRFASHRVGREIDPVESNWSNTTLDYAIYGTQTEMIESLSRFRRDVFLITYVGNVERLRELLRRARPLLNTC